MSSSSSSSIEDTRIERARWRFGLRNTPLIQLDSTGPAYIIVEFPTQESRPSPLFWAKGWPDWYSDPYSSAGITLSRNLDVQHQLNLPEIKSRNHVLEDKRLGSGKIGRLQDVAKQYGVKVKRTRQGVYITGKNEHLAEFLRVLQMAHIQWELKIR